MYPGTAAAEDSTTQAQNQSIPDFVRGYNKILLDHHEYDCPTGT
jgi:hypothetical protein